MRFKISEIILLFLITSAIWGSSLPGITLPGVGYLYPYRILVVLCFFLIVIFFREIEVSKKNFVIFCIIFFSFTIHGLISLFFSPDMAQAIFKFSNYFINFLFIIIIIMLINKNYIFLFVCKVIFINFVILLSVACYEIFSGNYIFYKGDIFVNTNNSIGFFYPLGPTFNTNDFATMLLLLMPFIIYYFMFKKNKYKNIFLFLINLIVIFILINTESRVIIVTYLILNCLIFYKLFSKKVLPILFFTIIIAILFLPSILSNFTQLIEQYLKANLNFGIDNGSGKVRLFLFFNALILLFNSAFLGVGVGNINYEILNNPKMLFVNGGSLHNLFLEILVEFGLFLFIIFILWIYSIYKSFNILSFSQNPELHKYKTILKAYILLLPIIGLASSSLTTYPFLWLYIGLLMVVPVCIKKIKKVN